MHDSSALPLERKQRIAERLARGEPVVATALALEFDVSEDSIRRDLRSLAAEGVCRRVYGGALPLSPASGSFEARSRDGTQRKRALAEATLPMMEPGQTVFLDSGSTNLQLAHLLPPLPGLRVVTNCIPIAAALATRTDLSLVVIGGAVDPTVGGSVDARATADLARFRFDLCILGACALSIDHGLAGFHLADVDFKQAAIAASASVALLLTSDKLETAAPFRIGPLGMLDTLVVEADAPEATVRTLRRAVPAVLRAPRPVGENAPKG
jgi:DeoR/GlpR family transcriptional regulator of sugar metabolism